MFLLLIRALAYADISPEAVDKAKQATALVEIKAIKAYGSAFCISTSGYFVTNAHVVKEGVTDGKVTLVLSPGEKAQRVIQAAIVRTDTNADLALLKADGVANLMPLSLGNSDNLQDTQSVAALGYPFGVDLAPGKDEYPSISVSLGRITSLRKIQGVLQQVQVDAVLNPGNSGGPLLNDKGQVIGVVRSGITGAGINFAIPVSHLEEFLHTPEIAFSPQTIDFRKISQEQEFHITVSTFMNPPIPYTVTLTLSAEGEESRSFTAKSMNSSLYVVKTIPLRSRKDSQTVLFKVKEGEELVLCRVQDQVIVVGGIPIHLNQVQSIEQGETPMVTLADSHKVTGKVVGLNAVETYIAGIPAKLNFSKVPLIEVTPADTPALSLTYHVVAKQGNTIVGEHKGAIAIEGVPKPNYGIVIVAPDTWPTSDTGYGQAPTGSTDQFVRNVGRLFTGGSKGHFLIYSTHWGFGGPFRDTLQKEGHKITVTMDPGPLEKYDGVFVGGNGNVDREALLKYVQHGGKLYVGGATGDIPGEEGFWNSLLQHFGLQYSGGPNVGDRVVMTSFDPVPLFTGVKGLILRGPRFVRILPGKWPHSRIISSQFGGGYGPSILPVRFHRTADAINIKTPKIRKNSHASSLSVGRRCHVIRPAFNCLHKSNDSCLTKVSW